jgi:hypothetical protein
MNTFKAFLCLLAWITAIILMAVPAHAISYEYYIGVDGFPTLTSGAYAGLANPNQGRLTFLHFNPTEVEASSSSHYHAIGAYSYAGPAGSPTIQSTNSNNRIPETFSGQPPLPLLPGTGIHEGRLISHAIDGLTYSNLKIQSTQALNGFPAGSIEHHLFNSSNGRWNGSLAGAQVGLQLVSLSEGLHIANETGMPVLESAGDVHLLGPGNGLSFTPTFWTDNTAADGTYAAQFRLLDLGSATGRSPFAQSGTFNIDFQVVPEPSTVTLLALGAGVLVVVSMRRRLSFRQSSMAA